MQNDINKKSILVSHTHWDRAWYLPFEEFRFRLIGMIDRILKLLSKDENFKCFVLDGQTILIDDYLEIRPENKTILKDLISNKKLIVGPWYILPDLFLVSGESIIRNLQVGHKMAQEYGGRLDVGYVPDPFGHIAQLPQILQGFDISTFIFMRGLPKEVDDQNTLLFNWKAPNNDEVLAYNTKEGYLNASNLGYSKEIGRFDCVNPDPDAAKTKIDRTISNLSNYHPHNLFLLNNGMDHMPEQPEIPTIIDKLNADYAEHEIVHGSFSDFMELAQSVGSKVDYMGNLLGNEDHPILLNVYSTRVYLKQQNQAAQSLLEKVTEPISVLSRDLVNYAVPDSIMSHAWKTLLKNHPHDDICGCSADGVHEDNEVRFRHVIENCNSICTQALEFLSKTGFDNSHLKHTGERFRDVFAFNPHPFSQDNKWISATVVFPNLEGEEEETLPERGLKAYNGFGEELELDILSSQAPYLKAEFIQFTWGRLYKLRIKTDLPPTGYQLIRIVETLDEPEKIKAPQKELCENNRYKVTANDSGLRVTEKILNIDFQDFITFEFTQDGGDTYSYSKASQEIYSHFERAEFDSHKKKLEASFSIEVPENLEKTSSVQIPIHVEIDLSQENQLQFHVSYENTAKNGRLRILLPVGFQAEESFADGHFMIYNHTKRAVLNPNDSKEKYSRYPGELNYTTNYQGDYCFVEGSFHNTWVANRGLNEYELIEREGVSYIAVTLHRAVGYLSVNNGSIRRPHAGPKIATPGAQCLRDITADLAWGTTTSNRYEISKMAKAFSHQEYVREMPVLHNLPQQGPVPRQESYLEISDSRIQLSAFKPITDSEDVILRLFNLSNEDVVTDIDLGFKVGSYSVTTMQEEWNENTEVLVNNSTINLEIPSHQILTLRLRK